MTTVKEINSTFNYIFCIIAIVGLFFTLLVLVSGYLMNDPMLTTRVGVVAASFGTLAIFGWLWKIFFLFSSK